MKESMKSVQAAKAGSYAHLPRSSPKYMCSKSRRCIKSGTAESPVKQGGDTNSEQDICIPAIYVIVVSCDP